MTDDEVRALAQRHSDVLENALGIIKAFRAAAEKLTQRDADLVVDTKRQRERKEAAATAWNRASGAISDALRAANISSVLNMSDGHQVDAILSAMIANNVGYPYINRAQLVVEAAAGRWEEYRDHPDRFPRAEETGPAEPSPAAPAELPAIEASKLSLVRILKDMTVGEWVGSLTVLFGLIGGAIWATNWVNARQLDDVKRERDAARTLLSAALAPSPAPRPSSPVTAPALSAAP